MKSVALFLLCFLFLQDAFSQDPKMVIPLGHSLGISKIRYSGDGKWIATASQDGTAKLWDARTGRLLQTFRGHSKGISDLVFTRDAKRLMTTSDNSTGDGTSRIWDTYTGELLNTLPQDFTEVYFNSSQTQMFLFRKYKDELESISVSTGKPIYKIKQPYKSFNKILVTPDDHFVITLSNDSIRFWSMENGAKQSAIVSSYSVNGMQLSPDGNMLALSTDEGTIDTWNYKKKQKVFQLTVGTEPVQNIYFINNGKLLLAEKEKEVVVFNTQTGSQLYKLSHSDYILELRNVNSSTTKIVTMCGDKMARRWNCVTGVQEDSVRLEDVWFGEMNQENDYVFFMGPKPVIWDIKKKQTFQLNGNENYGTVGCFSPDNSKIAISHTALEDDEVSARIYVWSLAERQVQKIIRGSSSAVSLIGIQPDNRSAIVKTYAGETLLWDLEKLSIIHNFSGLLKYSVSSVFLQGSKYLVTSKNDYKHEDYYPKIWDMQNGKLTDSFYSRWNDYASPVYNPANNLLYVPEGSQLKIFDAKIMKEVGTLNEDEIGEIMKVAISPDGRLVGAATKNAVVIVWDIKTGSIKYRLAGHERYAHFLKFSPSGKMLATGGGESNLNVWDMQTGKLLHTFNKASWGEFLNNEQYLGISTIAGVDDVKIWNLADGSLKWNLAGYNPIYSPSSNYMLYRDSSTNHHILFDLKRGQPQAVFPTQTGLLNIEFWDDKNIVLASYWDGRTTWYDAVNGKTILNSFFIDNLGYVSVLPSGYYLASSNAAKQMYYTTPDLKTISFDQLDIKYNRPDKVLEAIGNRDTVLINSYKRAYYKRIKKLGIDTTQFNDGYSVPEADFENRDAVLYEQTKEQISFNIKAKDSSYLLDRFNIWVNEVPLFGMKGISIRHRNSHAFDTTISINLSQGENRIETSVTNVNGTESYRMPLYVKYTAAQPVKETVHFIGIGINEFADNRRNLQWCVKDIRDLALKFKEKYGDQIIIDTLFNEQVTLSKVQALKQKLLNTKINDKVIMAYSGHGLLSKQYDYYLSSFDVNFRNPEEKGIAYEEIENLLDGIPARKKLLLIDACHSGEVDKDELLAIRNNKANAVNRGLIMNRGSEDETVETKTVGLQNSFELMQSLFVNVGKGTGATIISAAGGVQFAQERDDLENGVFTFSLLEAMMQNKTIKVSELKKYVGQRVEQLTNGLQKPTTRNDLKDFDWNVW